MNLTTLTKMSITPRLGGSAAAAPTPIAGLAAGERLLGIDYRPANAALYGVTTDSALAYPIPDVVAAAYTRNFTGTTATQLLDIDVANHSLLLQNPPNDGVLSALGRLDPLLSFDAAAGFDIAGGEDGLALAALRPVGAAQPILYRVNLATGAATALGAIGPVGSAGLRGLAIRLQ